MTIVEVLKQAKAGQKIRRTEWSPEASIEQDKEGYFIWSYSRRKYNPMKEELQGDKWEIVKEVQTWEGEVYTGKFGNIIFGNSPLPSSKIVKIKAKWET